MTHITPGEIRDTNAECRKRFERYLLVKATNGRYGKATKIARRAWREIERPYRRMLAEAIRQAERGL